MSKEDLKPKKIEPSALSRAFFWLVQHMPMLSAGMALASKAGEPFEGLALRRHIEQNRIAKAGREELAKLILEYDKKIHMGDSSGLWRWCLTQATEKHDSPYIT